MRFKSNPTGGYTIYAVCGVHSASFAIDFSGADTTKLLGFAVERLDPIANERYFMPNTKVFEKLVPNPAPEQHHSSWDHPIQSFVWDDFSVKPGQRYQYFFYPVVGQPKFLVRGASPVIIEVETEAEFDPASEHDVFFNRGVASSQAYARRFNNQVPNKIKDPKKREEAKEWLSRHLDDALISFINQAGKGDALRACFYEFHYAPIIDEFVKAIKRGVDVQIITDAKNNAPKPKKGKAEDPFPREANRKAVKGKITRKNHMLREANKSAIQHNKFIVLLKGAQKKPTAVWTGSTNISEGGIFGQTNVGHWVRNSAAAKAFLDYWNLMSQDPGNPPPGKKQTMSNADYEKAITGLQPDIAATKASQVLKGIACFFSPRPSDTMLSVYSDLLDNSASSGCITLAFGIGPTFKNALKDNTNKNALIFMLLEREDKPNSRSKVPFVRLTAGNNVYQAYGSRMVTPLYQWTREVTTQQLGLNKHVKYIHTKFMLVDPLSAEPLVVTGSANFSKNSTMVNDENMLMIKGVHRVADIYFTEFMRLFSHYYFRSVFDRLKQQQGGKKFDTKDSVFLVEDASWVDKYKPGTYRRKRLQMFIDMSGANVL